MVLGRKLPWLSRVQQPKSAALLKRFDRYIGTLQKGVDGWDYRPRFPSIYLGGKRYMFLSASRYIPAHKPDSEELLWLESYRSLK